MLCVYWLHDMDAWQLNQRVAQVSRDCETHLHDHPGVLTPVVQIQTVHPALSSFIEGEPLYTVAITVEHCARCTYVYWWDDNEQRWERRAQVSPPPPKASWAHTVHRVRSAVEKVPSR